MEQDHHNQSNLSTYQSYTSYLQQLQLQNAKPYAQNTPNIQNTQNQPNTPNMQNIQNPLLPIHHLNTPNQSIYKNNQLAQTRANHSIDQLQYQKQSNFFHLHQSNQFPPNQSTITYDPDQSMQDIKSVLSELNLNTKATVRKILQIINLPPSDHNLKRGNQSYQSIIASNLFSYDQSIGEFFIDHAAGKKMPIGKAYLDKLSKINKFLMTRIRIGAEIPYDKLKMLFSIHYESLQHLQLERFWENQEQHSFNFIENLQNLKKIRHLTLKGNYFSPKFLQKQSLFDLPLLEILQLKFEREMKDQQIYDIIEKLAQFNCDFKVRLWTDKQKKDFKGVIIQHLESLELVKKDAKKAELRMLERQRETQLSDSTGNNSFDSERESNNIRPEIIFEGIRNNNEGTRIKKDLVMGPDTQMNLNFEEGLDAKSMELSKKLGIQNGLSRGVHYKNIEGNNKNAVVEGSSIFGPKTTITYTFGSKKK